MNYIMLNKQFKKLGHDSNRHSQQAKNQDMKTGQRVLCVGVGNWRSALTKEKDNCHNPTTGMICRITDIHYNLAGKKYLILEGYGNFTAYDAKHFVPMNENWTEDVIASVLKEQLVSNNGIHFSQTIY
jgi:hypothetical protein